LKSVLLIFPVVIWQLKKADSFDRLAIKRRKVLSDIRCIVAAFLTDSGFSSNKAAAS